MFGKPKSKKYPKIVSIKSEQSAKDSIDRLYDEYRNAKTRKKKVRIARVAMQAANRTKASLKRKNLDPLVKLRLLKIHTMYKNAADHFYESL